MTEKVKNLIIRPPIVAVLGHVDHGKTSLLDFIRKTNFVAREAGGITQSIGAYEIIHNGKKITFIDTPGHEAFSKMRSRGAIAADLAILVVAADDGVKPQTKESIEILNSAKTPFVVAVNKIDKSNADIEKTINDLTANGVLLEGRGGNVSWQAISAKTGQGVDELLDLVLLAAEMENLTYNPDADAGGVIIEAKSDNRRGIVVSVIAENGILKIGDKIATFGAGGKIKILENFLGEKTAELRPSSPALIFGFENLPQVGETILKADVSGSLEILSEIIKNTDFGNIKINILKESIGEITDGDVKDAVNSNAVIVAFKTKINKVAESFVKAQNIKIISSGIIYELIDLLKQEARLLEKPLPQAELEILKIFSSPKGKKQLIGGRVVTGVIKNNIRLKIVRENNEIGTGKISSLRRQKQTVNEVKTEEECGLMFESDILIKEGDHLLWM
ncbi:MAG: Translation initiation factor IF-2 [Candidatus Wolfebacteria bacterium GW2011_GWA2_42_10]|uniref:Translation initiation factor IF-2 n=1 Tax=Candidatus Wolfebacteria bacterium GW2011_GWA2_42_10 TaxID=1619004 RepID=A0A0G0XL33_9BACT|nr:MAG: Translation initiation factor IF-2 [Candidatus Wolfebacteria bacterium GW2011_GWA2_42_10]